MEIVPVIGGEIETSLIREADTAAVWRQKCSNVIYEWSTYLFARTLCLLIIEGRILQERVSNDDIRTFSCH